MWTKQQLKEANLLDFRVFLAQIWDHLELRRPACKVHEKTAEEGVCSCPTRVQNDIALYIQTGPRRRMVRAYRGVGKSWMTVAYICWRLMLDPQLKIMVVSANQQLADDISKFVKALIVDVPMLNFLAPDRAKDQRTSNISFDVGPARPDKSPSVKSVGITGQLTGSRAGLIISDDVEVPKNSMTHLMRERLAESVKEYDDVLMPGGDVLYLGTPQVEQSLYNRLPVRGYDIRIWPSEVPETLTAYGPHLAPLITRLAEKLPVHAPTDPSRFNEEVLLERKVAHGLGRYALQYMLDTSPANLEKHPLKLGDLIITDIGEQMAPVKMEWGGSDKLTIQDLPPGGFDGDVYHEPAWESNERSEFNGTVMAIDPSGMGADQTAWAVVRYHHSMLYLVGVGGYKDGFSENTLRALAAQAAKFKVNEVTMERNYGGGMFGQLLRPVMAKACKARVLDPDECPWSAGMKEKRILDCLEPVVQTHKLVVDRRLIEADWKIQQETPELSWVFQFTRMCRDKGALAHEDQLEAIQIACQHWLDRMDIDSAESYTAHQEGIMDVELESYFDHVLGGNQQKWHTWM